MSEPAASEQASWVGAYSRRPVLVLAFVLLATLLAAWPASQLRLRSDLVSLLPTSGGAAGAYRGFLTTFGGVERVFIVIAPQEETPDFAPAVEAAAALATALGSAEGVASSRSGFDETDEAFVLGQIAPRLPLMLDAQGLADLEARLEPGALERRMAALRAGVLAPQGPLLEAWLAADPLGIGPWGEGVVAGDAGLSIDPSSGGFVSEDGRAALVIVQPQHGELDAAGGEALEAAIRVAWDGLDGTVRQGLAWQAVGGPLYALHDQRALRRDLSRTILGAVALVGLLIVVAFDGLAIPLAAMAALAVAQVWAAAAIVLGLGELSAVGVGFAAILVGLGDDYMIHLGANFRERWNELGDGPRAMVRAVRQTMPGILSAAICTAAAFAVLGLARFKPLAELGQAVVIGVVAVLASSLLVAAPVLLLCARRWRLDRQRRAWRGFGAALRGIVSCGTRRPAVTLALAGLAAALALGGVSRLRVDVDLSRLRPADHPAREVEQRLAEDFGLGLDTSVVVVHGTNLAGALDAAARVKRRLAAELGPQARVTSPSDWIVDGARLSERLQALQSLDLATAAPRVSAALERAGLDPQAFSGAIDGLEAIAAGTLGPPPWTSWPTWLRDAVRVSDSGAAVAVHVRESQAVWSQGPPPSLLAALERDAPGVQYASMPRLGAELREIAIGDLYRLGAIAVLLVGTLVLISFRGDLRLAALAAVPVLLGSLVTLGLWGALGRPLDLFSLAVLPVLLGIGVDDGLHVLHGLKQVDTPGDLAAATLFAGRGIVLTNLTTCAGFGSLALSQVPGLAAGGMLICLGNLACLAATLLVLPALGRYSGLLGRR